MDSDIAKGSGIVALLLAVIGMVRSWQARRRESEDDARRRIEETEEALRVALENGMITDAKRLAKRLESLRKRYSSRFSATDAAIAVCLLLLSGCGSMRQSKVEYVVVGERINIVEPGQVITVPGLIPPAKCWYMVDNVGLEGWLGIGDGR